MLPYPIGLVIGHHLFRVVGLILALAAMYRHFAAVALQHESSLLLFAPANRKPNSLVGIDRQQLMGAINPHLCHETHAPIALRLRRVLDNILALDQFDVGSDRDMPVRAAP